MLARHNSIKHVHSHACDVVLKVLAFISIVR